jgi:hypothetical protein
MLAGCGGDAEPTAAADPPSANTTSAAVASPSVAAEPMNAKAVVDALKNAGLPVTAIAEQDENSDPNDKLGRPGGYTSRASADVPGGDKNGDRYGIDRGWSSRCSAPSTRRAPGRGTSRTRSRPCKPWD